MDSIIVFIIAIAAFGAATYFDGYSAQEVKDLGGKEWNPVFKNGAGQFTPMRFYTLNAVFALLSIIAYANHWGVGGEITRNWQPAAVLILIAAAHVGGWLTNRSKAKQLKWRLENPGAGGPSLPPV